MRRSVEYDPQQIADLYEQGMTYQAIAKKLQVSTTLIFNALHRNTIHSRQRLAQMPKIRSRGIKRGLKYDYKEVIKRHDQGIKTKRIAADLGISTKTVYRVLKRYREASKE